jgi:hypothetical protein
MTEFEHHEAHTHGDCHTDCPHCAFDEIDRLAALQRRDSAANPDVYFIAPDQAGRPALWKLVDADEPLLVTRRDDWGDRAAWEMLEFGVRIALAAGE